MSEYIDHDATGASVGQVEKQTFTFGGPDGPFALDGGRELESVSLAYETCGTLNEDKSNAILICHALTGDSHVAGYYHPRTPSRGGGTSWSGRANPSIPTSIL